MIAINLEDLFTLDDAELLSDPYAEASIKLSDGVQKTKMMWLVFNKPFWRVLVKYDIPITKEISIWEGENPIGSVSNYQTRVFDSVRAKYGTNPIEGLNHDIVSIVNELYNIGVMHLSRYHSSISGYELAKTMLEPEIAELRNVEIDHKQSTTVNEAIFKGVHSKALEILRKPGLKHNAVYPFHRLGFLSTQQLPQTMISMGFRSDIDDMVIRYPLKNSFMSGMKTNVEYITDSLAAKMSTFYNKVGMPTTQYLNRQLQMVSMAIKNLYDGDCGTKLTIDILIPKEHARRFLYKHIVEEKTGKLVTLLPDNIDKYAGRVVQMRSPFVCKHTDGVCEVCGGLLTRYVPDGTIMGMASTIEVTEVIAQLTLSTKHYSRTDVSSYVLPRELRDIFIIAQNDIYINETCREITDGLEIGIDLSAMPNPEDLRFIKEKEDINEEHFSAISEVVLRKVGTTDILHAPISVVSEAKNKPFFTREFLWVLKSKLNDLDVDQILWIPLKGTTPYKPIMRCQVSNYSMRKYTHQIEQFLNSNIATYTSCSWILSDFSNLLYQKIEKNIYHLEMILRAYMVSGIDNWRVPVVEDPNDVMFSRTKDIDLNRTVGGQFAFERHGGVLKDPRTYLKAKDISLYDEYFGFNDDVVRPI